MRLTKLDPSEFRFLEPEDNCYHFGEYTAGGGFRASETNQQILNLKKKPTAPEAELYWKRRAINYWANAMLGTGVFRWDACIEGVTFVPFPCSKPTSHPEYDDRMLKVLELVAKQRPGIDIRSVLVQTVAREPQHGGVRSSPAEIAALLTIDHSKLISPLKPTVIIVDDVITRGASFVAAKQHIAALAGVQSVIGVFLARTIHQPAESYVHLLDDLDDEL